MFNDILITGSCVSQGHGLLDLEKNPELWINQLVDRALNYNPDQIKNISFTGISNDQVFLETAHQLINNNFKYVFVTWGPAPSRNLHLGLETYSTLATICRAPPGKDFNLVGGKVVTNDEVWEISQAWLKYYNYHWDFKELVYYVNILLDLAKSRNTKIYFINYSFAWGKNRYFDRLQVSAPNELDEFTQQVLQCDQRDDVEIMQLYKKIHDDYENIGGIHEEAWLNLYLPLKHLRVDVVDGGHPGELSQHQFADYLTEQLQKKLA